MVYIFESKHLFLNLVNIKKVNIKYRRNIFINEYFSEMLLRVMIGKFNLVWGWKIIKSTSCCSV